tara:strand:- start:51 stop:641 length:591 start_codon:yes stop_codon:yes gene_type:complete
MGYGDFQYYDILIFAGIAAFLVFRLRKVLGRRTGLEKNQSRTEENYNTQELKVETKKNIPDLNDNISKLKKAYETIDGFDHKNFLDGAKVAYETIINAFNSGDKKTLKSLLTPNTFLAFEEAINNKNNDPNSQVFSLIIERIEEVLVVNEKIIISIKFLSEQFKNNDETTIVKKEDTWSFEKTIYSKDPNWFLSST